MSARGVISKDNKPPQTGGSVITNNLKWIPITL